MTSPEKAGPSVAPIHRARACGSSWSEMIKLLHGADTLFAGRDDGSGLAVMAGAVRGLPACRISRPGMAISLRRKVAIMALPRHTPCPAISSLASPILVMPAHQARRKTWREVVELNRARLKEPAMSTANNESGDARDRCSAQCHAPPAMTTGVTSRPGELPAGRNEDRRVVRTP
jgi:hypothetical protein